MENEPDRSGLNLDVPSDIDERVDNISPELPQIMIDSETDLVVSIPPSPGIDTTREGENAIPQPSPVIEQQQNITTEHYPGNDGSVTSDDSFRTAVDLSPDDLPARPAAITNDGKYITH